VSEPRDRSPVEIRTARLRLREPEPEDVDPLAAMYADPEVMRFIGGGGPLDRAAARAALERSASSFRTDGYGIWSVVATGEGDAMIGRAGLMEWDIEGGRETEIVFLLARDRWGRGLATEAASAVRDFAAGRLRRSRLICLIYPDNERSIAVARKLGMSFERDVEMFGAMLSMFSLESA
jgi:ribosomal-protein-alanine N-acetyltransferase